MRQPVFSKEDAIGVTAGISFIAPCFNEEEVIPILLQACM
jgi:hypothetical protein